MKFSMDIAWLVLLALSGGCASYKSIVIGGDRVYYFKAGTDVPAVRADENLAGWYSLPAEEFKKVVIDE